MSETPRQGGEQTAKADHVDVRRMVRVVVALAAAMAAGVSLCWALMPENPPRADRIIRPRGVAEFRRWTDILIRDEETARSAAGASPQGAHFVVASDGDGPLVVPTRHWTAQALLEPGQQVGDGGPVIVIVLEGDLGRTPPGEAQLDALVALVDELATLFRVPLTRVSGPWDAAGGGTTFPTAGFLCRLGTRQQN